MSHKLLQFADIKRRAQETMEKYSLLWRRL
jgi:hypothetical protein